jgi:hypothetical protein
MTLWNELSLKEPASKDLLAAESNRETEPRSAAVRKRGGLATALLGFMVVFAAAGSNTASAQAYSPPSDGGATGIVTTTFATGFTMTTTTGIEVTVNEIYSTKTVDGPARDVRKGASVLVFGMDDGATITADWVVIQPRGDGGAAAAKANGVIPFELGVASPVQSVGTIPAAYTQGEGTLVSGIQAYIPVAVAQARYPGGIVDRVDHLSDGSYEVHNFSINWPHHVFVSKDFMFLGAE